MELYNVIRAFIAALAGPVRNYLNSHVATPS